MAYFKSNEHFEQNEYTEEETDAFYDDGFDELTEEPDELPELSEEELEEKKQSHVRLAYGAGNLVGVIAGTVLIGYGFLNFFIEFIREEPVVLKFFTMGQAMDIILFLLGLHLLFKVKEEDVVLKKQ